MATITIIGKDTPVVLGVELVRRESAWETRETRDTSQAHLVDQLLEQAEQHVDIHKVFCDRGFDTNGVRDVIDRTIRLTSSQNESTRPKSRMSKIWNVSLAAGRAC